MSGGDGLDAVRTGATAIGNIGRRLLRRPSPDTHSVRVTSSACCDAEGTRTHRNAWRGDIAAGFRDVRTVVIPPPKRRRHASDWNPVSQYDPHYDPHSGQPNYQRPPEPRPERRQRDGANTDRTALIIHTIAEIAAVFLGLWILLYLLEANQGNPFVEFVKAVADWLAWWAQDIFTMDSEGVRVFLNYGLPAVIYLLIGHGISARVRRL
jgi:hypothetical protein